MSLNHPERVRAINWTQWGPGEITGTITRRGEGRAVYVCPDKRFDGLPQEVLVWSQDVFPITPSTP